MTARKSILIRCDGSHALGLGHVIRSLAVAEQIKLLVDLPLIFLSRPDPVVARLIQSSGCSFHPVPFSTTTEYQEWIERCVSELHAVLLIVDVRDQLPRAALRQVRRRNVVVATIDDPSERRLETDLAFYPPVPQVDEFSWTGFTGQLMVGWDFVILRSQFQNRTYQPTSTRPTILVTMGGSDPAGLTTLALEALSLLKEEFHVRIVLGPAYRDAAAISQQIEALGLRADILQGVDDMASVMERSTLAVSSFGGTAYELACVGVPQVILSLTRDHAQSASIFEKEGIAIHLGKYTGVRLESLAAAVESLLRDPLLRGRMSEKARSLLDGQGAKNIAQIALEKAGCL